MKRSKTIVITFAALTMLGSGQVMGQADMLPISRTAGVLTVGLPRGKSTLMALTNVKIVASGTVQSAAGSVLTVATSPAALPNLMTAPHAVKIVSRADPDGANAYGLSASITAQTGQDLTVALSVLPNVGDECVVYSLSTIASVFGATNSAGLTAGTSSATADIVYLTDGGDLKGIFYKSDSAKWRQVSDPDGADQDGTVIPPGSGLLVARKSSGAAEIFLPLRGDALPGRHVVSVSAGFTIANNPFLVPTTLGSSGLHQYLTGGSGPGTADVLYLEQDGELKGYFFKNAGLGGTGWRMLGDSVTNQSAVLISPGKALLFKEQVGAASFALPEPLAK